MVGFNFWHLKSKDLWLVLSIKFKSPQLNSISMGKVLSAKQVARVWREVGWFMSKFVSRALTWVITKIIVGRPKWKKEREREREGGMKWGGEREIMLGYHEADNSPLPTPQTRTKWICLVFIGPLLESNMKLFIKYLSVKAHCVFAAFLSELIFLNKCSLGCPLICDIFEEYFLLIPLIQYSPLTATPSGHGKSVTVTTLSL